MPPLSQSEIQDVVRKLGGNPRERKQAVVTMHELCCDSWSNPDNLAAIAAAGAIPPLVQLLGPGSPAGVQQAAAGALTNLGSDC
jgi:hypothetical protein